MAARSAWCVAMLVAATTASLIAPTGRMRSAFRHSSPVMAHHNADEPKWVRRLFDQLDGAEELARRGGTVSDVIKQAKRVATKASTDVREQMQAAEARAVAAEDARDAATARAAAAEREETRAMEELAAMKRELADAKAALDSYKKQAADALGELDDAYEFEQNKVAKMLKQLQEQARLLSLAEGESKKAAAAEAAAKAEAAALSKAKRAVSDSEQALLEERDRLEGCLVDARTQRDEALCRARAAEARIGRKRKAMRRLAAQSAEHVRTTASRLRKLAAELSQSRME